MPQEVAAPPRWPRNPYALADLVAAIVGQQIPWTPRNGAAQIARWLRIKPTGSTWTGSGPITLLDLYPDSGLAEKGIDSIAAALDWLSGKAPWLLDEFGAELFERLLPYLVPVHEGAPPGAGMQTVQPTALNPAGKSMTDRSGASFLDPAQGVLNDCYLVAPMISVAWSLQQPWGRALRAGTSASDSDADFRIRLFPDRRRFAVSPNVPVLIDPAHPARRVFTYTRSNDLGESWPAIVEKAFALRLVHPDGVPPRDLPLADYHVLNNNDSVALRRFKWPQVACANLCGGTPQPRLTARQISVELEQTVSELRALSHGARGDDCATRQPVMATTRDAAGAGESAALFATERVNTGLVAEHCYAVLGLARRDGTEHIVLRNPWSQPIDPEPGHWLRGVWAPRVGASTRRVELNRLGVFAVPEIEFLRYFRSYCTVDGPALA